MSDEMNFDMPPIARQVLQFVIDPTNQHVDTLYDIIIETSLFLMHALREKEFNSQAHLESVILFNMNAIKCLSIKKSLQSVSFDSPNDLVHLGEIADPFSIWPLVRCQYEAFCAFNHLFLTPTSIETKEILYKLWVTSGLKYRQAFPGEQQETIEKRAEEAERIQLYENEIHATAYYRNLPVDQQERLDKFEKDKIWQVKLGEQSVVKLAWHEMFANAGTKQTLFSKYYAHLSLATHPSNVSVFQFRDLYGEGEDVKMAYSAVRFAANTMAFFIRDLCVEIPECRQAFNQLPLLNQITINMINRSGRAPEYTVNGAEHHI
jgi:hypothetical protein